MAAWQVVGWLFAGHCLGRPREPACHHLPTIPRTSVDPVGNQCCHSMVGTLFSYCCVESDHRDHRACSWSSLQFPTVNLSMTPPHTLRCDVCVLHLLWQFNLRAPHVCLNIRGAGRGCMHALRHMRVIPVSPNLESPPWRRLVQVRGSPRCRFGAPRVGRSRARVRRSQHGQGCSKQARCRWPSQEG